MRRWALSDDAQKLPSLETAFEIEHIYAKNRCDKEKSLNDPKKIESLGNKAILEKRINIRASDYRFIDKKEYYDGYKNSYGVSKEGTINHERRSMSAEMMDFIETNIDARREKILESFYKYIENNGLMR